MCIQTIKRIRFPLIAALILVLSSMAAPIQAAEKAVPISHFITPQEGSTVSSFVSVEVFMLNGHGQAVELGVDGSDWQPMTYAGRGRYQTIWNANLVPVGNHTLRARFVNSSRKAAPFQPSVNVIVINSMPPEPNEDVAQANQADMLTKNGDTSANNKAIKNQMVLAFGETGIISSHSTAIQFARVLEDSRCPKGTACVWAGAVEVELLVWTGINPEPDVIRLRLDPTQPDAAATKLSNNVGLTLRWVNPYPAGDPIPPEKYVIGLEYELN